MPPLNVHVFASIGAMAVLDVSDMFAFMVVHVWLCTIDCTDHYCPGIDSDCRMFVYFTNTNVMQTNIWFRICVKCTTITTKDISDSIDCRHRESCLLFEWRILRHLSTLSKQSQRGSHDLSVIELIQIIKLCNSSRRPMHWTLDRHLKLWRHTSNTWLCQNFFLPATQSIEC